MKQIKPLEISDIKMLFEEGVELKIIETPHNAGNWGFEYNPSTMKLNVYLPKDNWSSLGQGYADMTVRKGLLYAREDVRDKPVPSESHLEFAALKSYAGGHDLVPFAEDLLKE